MPPAEPTPEPFPSTRRALAAERRPAATGRGTAGWLLCAALLPAWAFWLLAVPVPRVARGGPGRVEVLGGAIELAAPVGGRIAACTLRLGAAVRRGDLLLVVEPTAARTAAAREPAVRAAALAGQQAAIERQLAAIERGEQAGRQEATATAAEAAASRRQAEAAAHLAVRRAERTARLAALGVASRAALDQDAAEAAEREHAAAAAAADSERRLWQDRAARLQQLAARAELERQLAALQAAVAAARAQAAAARAEIDRLNLRAPCDGELAAAWPAAAGSQIAAGRPLAVLVPRAPLRVVASLPATALGAVRPGQRARFWLLACPPPACPGRAAVVTAVGGELRHGVLPVELRPASAASLRALRHGLPVAAVEIELGRTTPARLLLAWATGAAPAGPPAPEDPEDAEDAPDGGQRPPPGPAPVGETR
jgi:membrane fusion protein (multidrug efflux system)